ncbi:hypothetical protein [Flavobacterium sp. DSR2-3-3]|uniref:hypothetical protein n=1 Tax=Flavobacterium sp. DSR2-3-3 TaxID=2804632 RepID=UPI003CE7DE18
MKKQETKGNKTSYSDVLYWSMSPMSKDKKYHITRVHESVLRKLIHYDKSNIKITYSNKWISKHTFLDITQIEKSIPHLEKKDYINCITFSKKNKNGELIKRRIININWNFIQEVLSEVPKMEFIEKETDFFEQISNESDGIIEVNQEDNLKKESVEKGVETTSTNIDFNVHEYLTKRKLEFAKQLISDDSEFEALYTVDKKALDKFFYYNENIWEIKTLEFDNEDLLENIHGVNLSYSGLGTQLKLFTIDKNDAVTDSFQLNCYDLNEYLKIKKIKFGDVTLDNYETLKQFEKKQLNI